MQDDTSYVNLLEATFTADDRRQLAKEGKAKPDGSFPIRNVEDLKHAISDFGRAGSNKGDKDWILRRAKELGADDQLPDEWKEVITGAERLTIGAGTGASSLVQLIEVDKTGKECELMLIEQGTSKNKYHYPKAILEAAAPLFNGVYAFADHTNDQEQAVRPERSVRDKVGRWSNVHYGQATVGGRLTEGLIGHLKVIAPWMRDLLRESVEMGEPDFVGVSIDALGISTPKTQGGQKVKEVTKIQKVFSVDVVTSPSAGGHLMRLVASDTTERRTRLENESEGAGGATATAMPMTPAEMATIVREQVSSILREVAMPLQEALNAQKLQVERLTESQRVAAQREKFSAAIDAATGLSELGQERLRHSFEDTAVRRDLKDEEVLAAIRESVQYEAQLLQNMGGNSGPRSTPRVSVGATEFDQHYQALVGMFENQDQIVNGKAIPRYRTIKEAYCRWSQRDSFEVDPDEIQAAFSTKYDSRQDHKRIQESVSTATWGQVYADVLYLMLIKAYRTNPVYNKWRAVVSDIENVPDFQQRHWTRLGGYGDLTTVPETATYPLMTSSTNEEVKYSVAKRGGLDDVTFEAIANDRVGSIRRIPIGMARAAARTLFKFVMNLITTSNPVMSYDSVALYNSAHGNGPDSNALSLTAIQTAIVKMRAQTAFSETSEILGERNKPKVFIVPAQLELVAQRLLNPSDAYLAAIANPSTEQSLDPQAYKGMNMDYIVYDVLTSSTAWWAVADPAEVATFVIGFLNGREDPELFVQDQPNVGSNFTADKVTYKVRHIYGGVVEDHRSFYQGNS